MPTKERYFLIHASEDGRVFMSAHDKAGILKEIEPDCGEDDFEFLDAVPEDWAYVDSGKRLVIKGCVLVPRPKRVVQTYEIE